MHNPFLTFSHSSSVISSLKFLLVIVSSFLSSPSHSSQSHLSSSPLIYSALDLSRAKVSICVFWSVVSDSTRSRLETLDQDVFSCFNSLVSFFSSGSALSPVVTHFKKFIFCDGGAATLRVAGAPEGSRFAAAGPNNVRQALPSLHHPHPLFSQFLLVSPLFPISLSHCTCICRVYSAL